MRVFKVLDGMGGTLPVGTQDGSFRPIYLTGSNDSYFFNQWTVKPVIDSLGRIYVAGGFTTAEFGTGTTISIGRICRLNPDGSLDNTFAFGTGFNSNVNRMVLDSDGKLYCVGAFTTYQGVTANRIIRLNPDGTKDTGFDNTTGFNNVVDNIEINTDGQLYICGSFSTYKGVAAIGIIKLNPDGTKDTSFINSTGFNLPNACEAIAIDQNGKIYGTGFFTSYKSVSANRIIRINPDGSRDTGFNVGTGFNTFANFQGITPIDVGPDNKVVVTGSFTTYKGVSTIRLAKFEENGDKDPGFDSGASFTGEVYPGLCSIEVDSMGRIYVGNSATAYKGSVQRGIFRILPNGDLDTTFNVGVGIQLNGYGLGTTVSGNFLYLGGAFYSFQGITSNNIVRMHI